MSEVKLISITPDAEKLILFCARVSSDQSNESTGLIRYLIRNKHWSPFELAHAVFEIQTSRAIAAQILRHRSFSFQEFSQRYATPHQYEPYKARRQAEKNRQSSVDDLPTEDLTWFYETQQHTWNDSIERYQAAIERGIAKESARFLLPLNTGTTLYMAGSIRSWIHYIELRAVEHTQHEHRVIALIIRDILSDHLPTIKETLWTTQ
jgi:thymidylate synthase (FAD)